MATKITRVVISPDNKQALEIIAQLAVMKQAKKTRMQHDLEKMQAMLDQAGHKQGK